MALVFCAAGIAYGQTASQRYLDDIKNLTAPAMEGRGDGTKGLTRAAHLIEQRYKSLGLEPAGKGSFLQPFTVVTGARLKADNLLHVQNGQAKTALKLNQDFVPFSFSSSGTASGPVVFAGYGASAGEFGYDDYAEPRRQGQDRCPAALRAARIFRQAWQHRTDPAFAAHYQSDQRQKPRSQGRGHRERKARPRVKKIC